MSNQEVNIRELKEGETPPYDLLLLADPSRGMVKKYLDQGTCYVAETIEEMVGAYVLVMTSLGKMEIVNIAVVQNKQGQGFGKRMVLDAIQRSIDLGAHTIEVGTGNSSLSQLALYQKCGFRITEIDRNFFTRHYQEKIYENGIQCVDMVRLTFDIHNK
jgi:ribosomal protein S18 acetylase RimI-like enzyme